MKPTRKHHPYTGFEQGPIRPPSEAGSLLIRVTRNCPWNQCSFCPVYKGSRFSVRPVSHVLEDIERVHRCIGTVQEAAEQQNLAARAVFTAAAENDPAAFQAAAHWAANGMRAIFLQDANSLILKPADLIHILTQLTHRFPWVERITSYARSHTVARINDEDLARMRTAGLNRIHIGLESGSDAVLKLVRKGATRDLHIAAGRKVKAAGMELSEYVMPGLGGKPLSLQHAVETAEALNQIDPDFIRLRTLAIPDHVALHEDMAAGRFHKLNDLDTARELHHFITHLDGITSTVVSDHILNLFQEINGTLPDAKAGMIALLERFLAMPPEDRHCYQIGRRLGFFNQLEDMTVPHLRQRADEACIRLGVNAENVDDLVAELMKRFV